MQPATAVARTKDGHNRAPNQNATTVAEGAKSHTTTWIKRGSSDRMQPATAVARTKNGHNRARSRGAIQRRNDDCAAAAAANGGMTPDTTVSEQ